MDKINIKDLVVFANHGVFEAEAILGQKFLISATLYTDTRGAGRTDELINTIHYGEVSQEITKYFKENRFQLIEAAAEHLAEHLLLTFPLIQEIELEIKKPWAPVSLPLDTVSISIKRGWHIAFGALGSNMGDSKGYLDGAIEALKAIPQIQVLSVSSYIHTAPYGYLDQDEFLNGAVMLRTLLTPIELLDVFQKIEQDANRVRKIHWGPRTLDLDVLFYDDLIINNERLTVPHVEIQKRTFVLEPLVELAPWWRHPIYQKTVKELLDELTSQEDSHVSND